MPTLNFKSPLFALVLCLVCLNGLATTKPLRVAVGLAKPPFVNEDLKTGYEVELIEMIFKEAKIPIHVTNMPNSRMLHEFEQKKLDVMINTNARIDDRFPTSIPYIVYQNVAVTKASKKLKIRSIADLAHLRIGAFQNAKNLLGPDYKSLAEANPNYREFAQQQSQVQMLSSDRIDVAVMEKMIFQAYSKDLNLKPEDYVLHKVFPENRYSTAFHDAEIRDKFNHALNELKRKGLVRKLAEQYRIQIEN